MPNVAELIRDHLTLTVDCVDRLYLNGYVPRLQTSGGVVAFLGRGDHVVPSPALFGQITQAFKKQLLAWCQTEKVRFIEFRKGERKDDVVQPYRSHFPKSEGVILVGVAQEKASSWTATKQTQGPSESERLQRAIEARSRPDQGEAITPGQTKGRGLPESVWTNLRCSPNEAQSRVDRPFTTLFPNSHESPAVQAPRRSAFPGRLQRRRPDSTPQGRQRSRRRRPAPG